MQNLWLKVMLRWLKITQWVSTTPSAGYKQELKKECKPTYRYYYISMACCIILILTLVIIMNYLRKLWLTVIFSRSWYCVNPAQHWSGKSHSWCGKAGFTTVAMQQAYTEVMRAEESARLFERWKTYIRTYLRSALYKFILLHGVSLCQPVSN